MEEALNLTQEQRLQQRLSPLQVRYVRLLEMTGPEVEDEVRQELEDNPALEAVDPADISSPESFTETAEELQRADYRNEDDMPVSGFEAPGMTGAREFIEPLVTDTSGSLLDSLKAQLSDLRLTSRQQTIALNIIGNLDDNGYLTRDSAAIAFDIENTTGLHVSAAEVREVLDIVRSLDPAGIGAVDLRQCLLLQLKRRKNDNAVKLATEIVTHYFDLLSLRHYDKLASALGTDTAGLQSALDVIRSLNPKPAAILSHNSAEDRISHIVPDFLVEADSNRHLTLTLLNNLPELQIERTFRNFSDGPDNSVGNDNSRLHEAGLFIKQKRDEAASFIKILHQRQATLFRVMAAIMKIQKDFFLNEDDESKLKPMILKDIANITHDDLSVISRAASGKYVATAYGVYPLKMFFNEKAVQSEDSSTREILNVMQEIIENEDKQSPLNDEALMEAMESRGYKIARRTVAKYRDKLGYPVARLRKEI